MPIERRVTTETPSTTDRTVVRTERRGGNGFLYFIVGALVVAVGVIGFLYYENQRTTTQARTQTEQKLEAIGNAADKLGDTVRDATRGADQKPQTLPAPQPVQPAQPAPQ
jgi:hypothetical protein